MFNLTQKVLFNLTLISQIEQIFLIFLRIPCYRHSGADAALPRPHPNGDTALYTNALHRQNLSIIVNNRIRLTNDIFEDIGQSGETAHLRLTAC